MRERGGSIRGRKKGRREEIIEKRKSKEERHELKVDEVEERARKREKGEM